MRTEGAVCSDNCSASLLLTKTGAAAHKTRIMMQSGLPNNHGACVYVCLQP
jgi:hypothetical protein